MLTLSLSLFTTGVPLKSGIEMKAPSGNLKLSKVLPFKPGVGQNIALHALPTARNFAFLISALVLP